MTCAALALSVGTSLEAEDLSVHAERDCGTWSASQDDGGGNVWGKTWLLSYLSGLSVRTNLEFFDRPEGRLTPEQIYLWMDNYCRANPLANVAEGASQLFNEITGPEN